jgi:regulator of sigma E protease
LDQPNTPDRADLVNPTPAPPAAPPSPAQPLTPGGWLMQNGPFIILLGLAVVFAYQKFGGEWILNVVKAGLGIGFIIFIHELGHFLAAKWCDVHVMTFSIGFGPAIPGCSFTRGETTYKLAILPIGGFVNMVGEGPEADEEEDYPRSFKNKTVFQRMVIISAGVIMNVAFGMACFVGIYLTTGVSRHPAVISQTSPGSPAWINGVRAGWTLTDVDGKEDPWWNQMHVKVALSSAGKPIPFTFVDREGKTHKLEIEPFRDDNNDFPFIGVEPPNRLELVPSRYKRIYTTPVGPSSPAARARVLELGKGDAVVSASIDDAEKLTILPSGAAGWAELARLFADNPDKMIDLNVRRAGKVATEKVAVPAVGFDFGDAILGTTNPATPDEPFDIAPLPTSTGKGTKRAIVDVFEYRKRLVVLAGKPIVLQVRRAKSPEAEDHDGATVTLFVPPAYRVGFGARMNMGKIAALRIGSPASKAGGPTVGDVITGVKVIYGNEPPVTLLSDKQALDPVRLPYELERTIRKPGSEVAKWKVVLTVRGTVGHDAAKERTLAPMACDDSFSLADEQTRGAASPMSIPQLGIAYWVESTVVKVDSGSAAYGAGLLAGDEIREINIRKPNPKNPDEIAWAGWQKMASHRERGIDLYDQWAYFFDVLQQVDYPQIRLKVKRGTELLELPPEIDEPVGIVATPDTTWPMAQRGLNSRFLPDTRRQKAHSILEAVQFGVEDTGEFIRNIYMNLSRLITRRISTRSLGGPIEIATQAFSAAGEDVSTNLLFLAMISINLAVVNFLPIPLLDGGHMVFLIYEKIRRRPPSEMVRIVATYIGLAFILSLMIFVLYLDISRRWF